MGNLSKHASFYLDTVTFLVEDCLFKVPRDPLKKESVVFRDVFLLPKGVNNEQEGQSDDNPIHLEGIKKDDFEELLGVLLHRTHGTSQRPLPETNDQWTSVVKLASLWGFSAICQVAAKRLEKTMSPVDRVVFGKTYDLDFESWTLPAMNEIVRRREPITFEEGQQMGFDIALKLASGVDLTSRILTSRKFFGKLL